MYQLRFRQLDVKILFSVAWVTLILMLARLWMGFDFIEPGQLEGRSSDVTRMLVTSLRYDLRVAALAIAPAFLIGMVAAVSDAFWHGYTKILMGYIFLISFIVTATAISNYFYYETYHTVFDIFVFGLADDDTWAVLGNIWQDYPVINSILLTLIVSTVGGWLLGRLGNAAGKPWHKGLFALFVAGSVLFYFVIARGSIGTFPLRRANAQVSELAVINQLTPNAFMALDWAVKDREEADQFHPVSLKEGERLRQKALGNEHINQTTPVNPYLAAHKPNVVLAMMESFGSNMLAMDNPQSNDLLGSLRSHFETDFLFKRFLPADNGTAPSLTALLFNSPAMSITVSSAQKTPLQGSVFRPYKKAGYQTVFITSGNMMWRNLVNYLPIQGVDKIYDQNSLMDIYPQSRQYLTDWGVPDEYAFNLADKLIQSAEQPLFIFILTMTNHPPYVTPGTYKPSVVEVTEEYRERAGGGQIELKNILTTFQYSADALGHFITSIKASKQGENTLIAATGDHQMRRVKAHLPEESVLEKAVPFYLYVPEAILGQVDYQYDHQRVGSHKDILPTLYHFSLSDQDFIMIGGTNMLRKAPSGSRDFGHNKNIWIEDDSAIVLDGFFRKYRWKDKEKLTLESEPLSLSSQEQERIRSFAELQEWWINNDTAGSIR